MFQQLKLLFQIISQLALEHATLRSFGLTSGKASIRYILYVWLVYTI